MKLFYSFADKIICNSEKSKKLWLKYFPNLESKIDVIYNTVSLNINSDATYIPNRDGKLNIVVAASYQYLKNLNGVLDALLLLTKEQRGLIYINWYGRRTGSNSEIQCYNSAVKKIEENNLQTCIILNDSVTDINSKMFESDFVGLFSFYEGFPNAICEGMMLGKPIIISRVSDYSVIVNNDNGYLCDSGNPRTIANAFISAITNNKEEILRMGQFSKFKAFKLFSNQIILQKWMNLFTIKN